MSRYLPTPSHATVEAWGRRLVHYPRQLELSILFVSSVALAFAIASCATYHRFDRYTLFWNLPTPLITVCLSTLHLIYYAHNNEFLHSSNAPRSYTSPKSPSLRTRPPPNAFRVAFSESKHYIFTFTTPILTPSYTATLSALLTLAWVLQLRYSSSLDYYLVLHPGRHHIVHTKDVVLFVLKVAAFVACCSLYLVYCAISALGMREAKLRESSFVCEKDPRNGQPEYKDEEVDAREWRGLAIRLMDED